MMETIMHSDRPVLIIVRERKRKKTDDHGNWSIWGVAKLNERGKTRLTDEGEACSLGETRCRFLARSQSLYGLILRV